MWITKKTDYATRALLVLTLATSDRGFSRFPGLKLQFPLAA